MEKENKSKKDNFKSALVVGGVGAVVAATVVGVGIGSQDSKSIDMSNYNVDNTKYMDYAKSADENTLDRLALLEENVRLYNNLSSGKLTPAQEETLKNAKSGIKREMSGQMIGKLYLNIFKEKMKSAYDADKIIVKGKEFKDFSVEIYDGYNKSLMDDKDKTSEVKSAVMDIIELQSMIEKDSFEEKDVKEFVKVYENMKGFSNLEFVKEGDKPLAVSETYKTTLQDGTYTIYHMDLSDKDNPKVENKTEIEVKNGYVNEGEEK